MKWKGYYGFQFRRPTTWNEKHSRLILTLLTLENDTNSATTVKQPRKSWKLSNVCKLFRVSVERSSVSDTPTATRWDLWGLSEDARAWASGPNHEGTTFAAASSAVCGKDLIPILELGSVAASLQQVSRSLQRSSWEALWSSTGNEFRLTDSTKRDRWRINCWCHVRSWAFGAHAMMGNSGYDFLVWEKHYFHIG